MIERLEARGHEVFVTAREYGQTLGVLDRLGIPYESVGHHAGASSLKKGAAVAVAPATLTAKGRTWRYRFDLAEGSWRQIGDVYLNLWLAPMDDPTQHFETEDVLPRFGPLVAPLEDGRILVAGGDGYGDHPTTATARLYDPDDDSWADLPPLPEARAAGAAVTLPDGSVLVVGGHRQQATDSGVDTFSLPTAVRLVVSP